MALRSKEKAAQRRENAEKRPHATAKYIRISSRKVKVVIDLIRGKKVDDALAILEFTPKSAAPVVKKLLESAIANGELKQDDITFGYDDSARIVSCSYKLKEKQFEQFKAEEAAKESKEIDELVSYRHGLS